MTKFYLPLFPILLVFIIACNQQNDYIAYYNLCNSGDKEKYFENYEAALENYETAFKEVDYVHADYYRQAAECAMLLNDYSTAANYYKQALLNGFELWSDFGSEAFKESPHGIALKKNIGEYTKKAQQKINQPYKAVIDSLYYVDQVIIRGGQADGDYNIDRTKLPANLFDLDKSIFNTLMNLVVKYGFPSEAVVGTKTYGKASIIFHHNIRLPENSQYMNFAKSALKDGKYLPANFAWMYDQSLLQQEKKPLFYYGVPGANQLTDVEKEAIDMERAKYGIKPLASTKFEESEYGVSMSVLW